MITVIYDPVNGATVPDANVSSEVDYFILAQKDKTIGVVIGSELIINEFRVRLYRKEIEPSDIKFMYEGVEIDANVDGRLKNWPTGFCDTTDKQLSELIGW
jgi:hypothetical protein